MKAKNNKTGEIVTNFGISKEFGTISYIDSTNTLRFSTASDGEWTIIEEETSFDWQSFRAEAAKDILSNALIPHTLQQFDEVTVYNEDVVQIDFWIDKAVEWSDKLISKLKEKEEE